MKRWLLLIGLMLVSGAALATTASFPELFKPAPQDLSIWYLGNIFGADLMTGLVDSKNLSNVHLLSVLFGIFNQIALVVGIIIIVYTVLAGTLNTAHEGKPLGEKWNSVWMPVRISAGIALLVPKGGTGYCLAQSLVMWLAVQGIGSADQVWNAMIDYFAQGGAIYSNKSASAGDYLNQPNVYYTLQLQGDKGATTTQKMPGSPPTVDLLKSMVCIQLFNDNPTALELNNNRKYEVYTMQDVTDTVYFGDRQARMNAIQPGYAGDKAAGMECGAVIVQAPECPLPSEQPHSKCGTESQREQIYTLANWNMAQGLQSLAKELATTKDVDTNWASYYSNVYHNSELYVNYLVGYQDFLFFKDDSLKPAKAFDVYKKYGWILAGNYYTILSGFKERADYLARKMIPPNTIGWVIVDGISTEPKSRTQNDDKDQAYTATGAFWLQFNSDTLDDIKSYMPSYEQEAQKSHGGKHSIGIVNMDEIFKSLANTAGSTAKPGGKTGKDKKGKRGSGAKKGQASAATLSAVKDYIKYLTGEGTGTGDLRVAKDPILRASEYGKSLTSAAIAMMVVAGVLNILLAASHVCEAIQPIGYILRATGETVVVGLIALAMFMYTQGAMLGVFIPLIPYVTFFIGVVGWLMQVVEAIAAAPLVAIGLIFPETRDDIWGRAAPAYMMILGLFLRPPLMLVGFAAAMMVLWVLTELLNIGFLTLTAITFRIEDMFGFVVIMTAYTAIFTVVVTRSYELINVVPNKVLNWIGGPGMEVEGAREAIGAAKGGVQEGAAAVSGGMKATGDAAVSATGKQVAEKNRRDTAAGSASLDDKPK